MAEGTPATRRWMGRLAFTGIALGLVFLRLLPLDTLPRGWAPPDLLLAATMAWTVRRPEHVPVLLVAALFLLTDLLFHRPPGLMAAAVVIATEALRRRHAGFRTMPFPLEWATVSLAIVGLTFGVRLTLAALMMPQAPMALTMIEMGLTILSYPLVVGFAYVAFGLTRRAPGAVDALGHRL
ncbi:hypothetical protein [Wenxinia marina]|uniref:Rod shape-determining protein MreD n=1 Tax=Wenxinia marina DSM 24838 TaxID=1123501 RepID=A0A0D0Q7L7_9RHOB|nr:hypothetical protein [Wenxinia marina]KIQ70454.1 hypothetical protein Wenmar_00830 [Wenxinia marina DSM 24838]GGL53015.1 hypothetical protein GCM10011392_04230 [Wenxinia marina]